MSQQTERRAATHVKPIEGAHSLGAGEAARERGNSFRELDTGPPLNARVRWSATATGHEREKRRDAKTSVHGWKEKGGLCSCCASGGDSWPRETGWLAKCIDDWKSSRSHNIVEWSGKAPDDP